MIIVGLPCVIGLEMPPFSILFGSGGPATDVQLSTEVIYELGKRGYGNLPMGVAEIFGDEENFDDKVTLVIYQGEAAIIIEDDTPSLYRIFAYQIYEILEDKDIEKSLLYTEDIEENTLAYLFNLTIEEDEIDEDDEEIEFEENKTTIQETGNNLPKEETEIPQESEQPVVKESPLPQNPFVRILNWFKGLF